MIDKEQLRDLIEQVLHYLEPEIPYSETAVELLMLTAAQESHLGTYLKQLGEGPARGIFQMEPATESDIYENYLKYKTELNGKILDLHGTVAIGEGFVLDPLQVNLAYQIAMARVHYRRVSDPLPEIEVTALAAYWKKHYNTRLGRGTVEEAVHNYLRFVA